MGCKPTILRICPAFLFLFIQVPVYPHFLKVAAHVSLGRIQFPWLISQSSSFCALKKMVKTCQKCWGSKSQILHEEGSDWQFLQSPNLARLIVHNSHMHLYALYFPYVCCWCSGFSVAILLDWRVVGFSHCLSPVKWMVLQQQHRKDGIKQCSKSIEILCHSLWLVD